MRTDLVAAVILAAALLQASPARRAAAAESLLGKPAPEIDVREWINAPEPLKLAGLKGKAVLIAYWGMKCTICQCGPVIQKLGPLDKKYRSQGLVVMALHIHEAEASEVDAFCLKRGVEYPVGHGGYNPTFGVELVPHMFLVDPEGIVVWDGKELGGDFNAKLSKALSQVDWFGETKLSKTFAAVKKLAVSRQFAKAVDKLVDIAADTTVSDAEKDAAREFKNRLEDFGERQYMKASSALRMKDTQRGLEMLETLASEFKDHPLGRKAAARLKEARQEEENKPFIEAGELYRKFRDCLRQGNPRAAGAFAARLLQKHPESPWSKVAASIMDAWDKVQ